MAAGRDESGMGMTTSMSPIGVYVGDRVGEAVAEPQPRLVDRDAVHDRVGAGEVDVLERAGHEHAGSSRTGASHLAVGVMKTASPGATSRTTS